MNDVWDPIDPKGIRAALADDRYVYAQPATNELSKALTTLLPDAVLMQPPPFRIYQFRTSKGYHYGKRLNDGRWVRIAAWQVR